MNSIAYYNKNAEAFYRRTIDVDMSQAYKKFLTYLPAKACILDAGCGPGRDAKYFKSKGHKVTAFDASSEMVRLSSLELGHPTLHLSFHDMTFDQEFDGVWASASLLHVPYKDMRLIFQKIHTALKIGGIFYASYKYGGQMMPAEDRDFYNMTEETIVPYLKGLFDPILVEKDADTRSKVAPSPEKAWLHILCRKGG